MLRSLTEQPRAWRQRPSHRFSLKVPMSRCDARVDTAPDVVTVKTLLLGLPSKSLCDLLNSNVWSVCDSAGPVEVRIDWLIYSDVHLSSKKLIWDESIVYVDLGLLLCAYLSNNPFPVLGDNNLNVGPLVHSIMILITSTTQTLKKGGPSSETSCLNLLFLTSKCF